jgi:chromosome segregation ATPase
MTQYAYPTEQQLDARLKAVEQELKDVKETLAKLKGKHDDVQGQADNINRESSRSANLQNRINGVLARATIAGGKSGLSQEDLNVLAEVARLK